MKRIRQILKHGTWLYDGTVKADVWIVRQNYFEGPVITDEEPTPGYPPTDAEGCFYFPEYRVPGAGAGSGGSVFSSPEEAIRRAEDVLKSQIVWNI
jgi:hypothetical protein